MAKNILEIRRTKLKQLADARGHTSLAKLLGYSGPSYISQMIGGGRPITEKTARYVEKVLTLPAGWLDDPKHEPPATVNESLVRQVVLLVGGVLQDEGISLDPHKFSELVEIVYEDATRTGRLDDSYARRVVKLVKGAGA